jgi:hypothetical protein
MPTPSGWHYFSVEELACPHCGKMFMNADFMDKVVKLRGFYGQPLRVMSAFRCPEYDARIGSSTEPGSGPHTMGRAIDLRIAGKEADALLTLIYRMGCFTGKGFNQKQGTEIMGRYFHLDDLKENEFLKHPRPSVWSY